MKFVQLGSVMLAAHSYRTLITPLSHKNNSLNKAWPNSQVEIDRWLTYKGDKWTKSACISINPYTLRVARSYFFREE